MNHKIIDEPVFLLKRLTRNAIGKNMDKAYATVLLFMVLIAGVNYLFQYVVPFGKYYIGNPIGDIAKQNATVSYLATIYLFLVGTILSAGLCAYMLNLIRKGKSETMLLFKGFSKIGLYFKILLQQVLVGVIVLLGLILLIVPGFIFALRLNQAIYILMDDPSKGVFETISESWNLMRGNSGKLFLLLLSFIPYLILIIAAAVFCALCVPEEYINFASLLVEVFLGGLYEVMMIGSFALFHEILTGHLVVEQNVKRVE